MKWLVSYTNKKVRAIKVQNEILTVKNLKKYFFTEQGTVKAVDNVDFFMKTGDTLGLVGESGSGKSTVAYTVMGIYSPTEGEIFYKGEKYLSKTRKKISLKLRKEMQIVFQDPGSSLNASCTVQQILELPLKVHKIARNKKERLEKVKELLEMVQLPQNYLYKYPAMIGGGEKQMVSIARALAVNPSCILLDEPTSALDVSIQAKIIKMLMDFQKKLNLSYLFITHDLSLMRNVASRVAIMYLGKICEIAPTKEFFNNPLHPYTQMLLSSIPVITEEEEKLKPKKIISKGEIPSPVNIPSGCGFRTRCPRKMDICSQKQTEMIEVSKDHFVRCHLFSEI